MAFRLANVADRAVLIDGEHFHDLEQASGGALGTDPMAALGHPSTLAEVQASLVGREPSGVVADVALGPPVPRPRNSFGIGLNYHEHAAEGQVLADHHAEFEHLFGTPHGLDFAATARAFGVGYTRARELKELAEAVARPPRGPHVVELRFERSAGADAYRAAVERVRTALGG